MPLNLKDRTISNIYDRLKNSNWKEADQLAISKHDQGVELMPTEKQLQLRTFARKFSNIDFFLRILPLKVDELVMSEM